MSTPALRALGNRWLEILWHCLIRGVRYDEAIHVANRNRALQRAALNVPYLGESYATKYLFFCQPAEDRPRALILDDRVRTWLREHGRPDLDGGGPWSVPRYAAYLDQAHRWAADLGCAPDDVEYLIFHIVAKERGDRWQDEW